MKTRILFIFALFLILTGFYGEDRVVEQNGINLQERISGEAEAPSFTEKPKCYLESNGTEIIISARFKAEPEPEIRWYRGTDQIKAGEKYDMPYSKGVAMLVIKKIGAEDAGSYRINLKNTEGEVNATVKISFTPVENN